MILLWLCLKTWVNKYKSSFPLWLLMVAELCKSYLIVQVNFFAVNGLVITGIGLVSTGNCLVITSTGLVITDGGLVIMITYLAITYSGLVFVFSKFRHSMCFNIYA